MASQSPPRIWGGRAMSHTHIITTNGDDAAADFISQSVMQMKVQLAISQHSAFQKGSNSKNCLFQKVI